MFLSYSEGKAGRKKRWVGYIGSVMIFLLVAVVTLKTTIPSKWLSILHVSVLLKRGLKKKPRIST